MTIPVKAILPSHHYFRRTARIRAHRFEAAGIPVRVVKHLRAPYRWRVERA